MIDRQAKPGVALGDPAQFRQRIRRQCRDRNTGIFGGFTPFVATWLIAVTGNSLSPSFYMMLTAGLSIIALVFVRRRGYPRLYPALVSPR